jgi:hypothetical protein
MQAFSSLGIELLKFGFHPVVFLECECPEHGTFRFGVMPDLPTGDRIACPRCNVLRHCSGILATGYTRKPLPLEPERVHRAVRWQWIAEEERRPKRIVGIGNRARHYRKSYPQIHPQSQAKIRQSSGMQEGAERAL